MAVVGPSPGEGGDKKEMVARDLASLNADVRMAMRQIAAQGPEGALDSDLSIGLISSRSRKGNLHYMEDAPY